MKKKHNSISLYESALIPKHKDALQQIWNKICNEFPTLESIQKWFEHKRDELQKLIHTHLSGKRQKIAQKAFDCIEYSCNNGAISESESGSRFLKTVFCIFVLYMILSLVVPMAGLVGVFMFDSPSSTPESHPILYQIVDKILLVSHIFQPGLNMWHKILSILGIF